MYSYKKNKSIINILKEINKMNLKYTIAIVIIDSYLLNM